MHQQLESSHPLFILNQPHTINTNHTHCSVEKPDSVYNWMSSWCITKLSELQIRRLHIKKKIVDSSGHIVAVGSLHLAQVIRIFACHQWEWHFCPLPHPLAMEYKIWVVQTKTVLRFTFNAWSSEGVTSKRGSKRVFHCSFLYCYCCQLWYGSEGVNRQRWRFGLKGNGIVTLSFVLFLSDHLHCCESMKAFAVVALAIDADGQLQNWVSLNI